MSSEPKKRIKKTLNRNIARGMGLTVVSQFQNILVSIDDSPYSLQTQEVAASLAKSFNSKVTVLHVVPHEIRHQRGFDLPRKIQDELEGSIVQKGRQIIQNARSLFAQEGVTAETILEEFADPTETILQLAKEKKSDTVVLGNRGTSSIEEFGLGGVAEKVLTHADRPLLIVKKRAEFSRILVAVDGSVHAKKALDYAAQLALKYGGMVTVLNVAQGMIQREAAKTMGERIVSDAEAQVKGVKVDKRVEFGHPAKVILEIAKKGNYDVIAMGRRGLNPVSRFLLGSTSDRVARHAPCSVLVVR